MLIMSLGCLQFSRESCLLYAFLLGYLPSIFCDFGEKPIDFYLQDSFPRSLQGISFLLRRNHQPPQKITLHTALLSVTGQNGHSADCPDVPLRGSKS